MTIKDILRHTSCDTTVFVQRFGTNPTIDDLLTIVLVPPLGPSRLKGMVKKRDGRVVPVTRRWRKFEIALHQEFRGIILDPELLDDFQNYRPGSNCLFEWLEAVVYYMQATWSQMIEAKRTYLQLGDWLPNYLTHHNCNFTDDPRWNTAVDILRLACGLGPR